MAKLQAERLQWLRPVAERALSAGQAKVVVPGEAEHDDLIQRYASAVWAAGFQQGLAEVATHDVHRPHTFADDPPGTPKLKPQRAVEWAQSRVVLQGQWQRSLDGAVTALLVNALETGATIQDTMRALQTVFPNFSKARLENIARTESVAAYNQGRLAAFRANPFVRAVQFSAVLDARTTEICRERDGLILAIDDERLPGNTPPLHYQCRSTLIPITRYQWNALQDGDRATEEQFFGWVRPGGPRNFREATEAWDRAPAPLPGFGTPADVRPRPPHPPAPAAAAPPPTPATLKTRVEEAVTNGGAVAPEDVSHLDLIRGGKVLADEIQAIAEVGTAGEVEWRRAVGKVLGEVRPTGSPAAVKFAQGSTRSAKALVNSALSLLPDDWSAALAQDSQTTPMKATVSTARAGYRAGMLRLRSDPSVVLHEVGHWLEQIGYSASPPADGAERVFGQAMDFLKSRTRGENLESLRRLTGIPYAASEKTRKDRFSDPYVGKDYGGSATEITSMGLEAIFFRRHRMWDNDPEMIHFILGMLSWL